MASVPYHGFHFNGIQLSCLPASLAGIPAVSVPCGRCENDLPVGLQVHAPALREDVALRVAAAVESQAGQWDRLPEACA